MNTIHDVAKLAGVSTATVSNVINNSKKVSPGTVERVQNAIRELNYTPNTIARGLKTSNSRIIGILAEDIGAFFSGDIIDGICEYCELHDYSINLCNLRVDFKVKQSPGFRYTGLEEDESYKKSIQRNLNTLLASRVCGLIFIGTHPRDVGSLLPDLPIPVVYTYAYTRKGDYCINYDDYQGTRLAVDYLIENGHERIALICGAVDSVPTHKRMRGYQELMASGDPPTAIFAMNDLMAVGALNALRENGFRVPQDVSVHGFDDLEMSHYTVPALTTIKPPLREMGRRTAQTMDNIFRLIRLAETRK